MRNWGLISGLAQHHRVSLLTFSRSSKPIHSKLLSTCIRIETITSHPRKPWDRVRTMLFSSRPDIQDRLAARDTHSLLQQLLAKERYNAIHIEGLEMASYAPTIRRMASNYGSPKLIYDAHNAETIIQLRAFATDVRDPRRWPQALYSLLQLPRLRRFERATCDIVDKVLCVSHEDANALRQLTPGLKPVLVPNGLFLSDYDSPPQAASLPPCSLVFSGKMNYRPNVDAAVWFAEKIFPRILTRLNTSAEFVIVGKEPTERVKRLGEHPNITITGAVEDMRQYLAATTVYVAPLRMGGGTRFKLLEAMALRRAIVTTTVGAEGLNVTNGRELTVADSPTEQADEILSLLQDEERRAVMGANARAFVELSYDWSEILPAIENIYQDTWLSNK